MKISQALSNLKNIKGLAGFIFIDINGRVIAHNKGISGQDKLSNMVYNCGCQLSQIGKRHFKYAAFSRPDHRDILIFPVGRYYLGVIKQTDVKKAEIVSAVTQFLNVITENN